MKIKNVGPHLIEFTDLRNPIGGNRFLMDIGAEEIIYNEDAERSNELGHLITVGKIAVLGLEEPFIQANISNVENSPAALLPGSFSGTAEDTYTFPTTVNANKIISDTTVTADGGVDIKQKPVPANPALGYGRLYVNEDDKLLHFINSDGIDISIGLDTITTVVEIPRMNVIPAGLIDGTNTIFILPNVPADNTLALYMNGIRLLPVDDYTLDANVITITPAPKSNWKLCADYIANHLYV